jgi:hypothetical protein
VEVKIVVCTPCYTTKKKHTPAIKRYRAKEVGSNEEHIIDVCASHDKRLSALIGGPAEQKPDGNVCPKSGCGRGFTTRRGLNRHISTMKHGKKVED